MDPKYTDAQREAVCHLINHDGLGVKATVTELAANGHGDIEPFDIPWEYARKLAARDRQRNTRRLAEQDITTAIDTLVRRGIEWADTQLPQGQTAEVDPDKVSKVFRTLVDIDKLAKANRPTKATHTDEETEPKTALDRLASQLVETPQSKQNGHNTPDQHHNTTPPEPVS